MKDTNKLNTRQKILLLFLTSRAAEIDPIRIMKGLFIFSQEALEEWIKKDEIYSFIPYSYGPCSFDVYDDLKILEHYGYISSTQVPGQSWKYYSATSLGRKLAVKLENMYQPNMISFIKELRDFVSGLSFERLLEAVYNNYPEYATNSVFK